MPRKPTDTVQLKLRFSEKLRARIEAAANKDGRSMNGEIIHRLEQSFSRDERAKLIRETADATASAVVLAQVEPYSGPDLFEVPDENPKPNDATKPKARKGTKP